MFRARSTSTLGTSSLLSWRSARPGRARARRRRGRRRTCRDTGGRGSRRRRSGAGRRSWRSGCPSAAAFRTCRAARGSKKTSVRLTYCHRPAPRVEEVDARRGHDALVEVRAAAVVPDIIDADHERGDPEDLGPRELRLGHPDAGLGGGHDQRPGVGEPQGGGEVDREAKVGRLQRGGLQLHRTEVARRPGRRNCPARQGRR